MSATTKKAGSSASRRSVARRANRHAAPPFAFSDAIVAAGSVERLDIPVARLPTGNWVSLPVVVLHGVQPGPVVWFSAALHGDELNGVVIVDELVRRLEPTKLAGTILAVPIVNAFGLIQGSRYLPDRRDLNRMFPGSARGSVGARLAYLLSGLVISRADLGIDFHTGSGGRSNLPQIRCDLENVEARRLATAFGAPVALHSSLRDGSLRAHAASLGKPTLLYEAGEAHRLDDAAIEIGVSGALRVLTAVGVIQQEPEPPPAKKTEELWSSSWVRTNRSGFCRLSVKLGDPIEAGAHYGFVMDPASGHCSPLKSKLSGIVIGRSTEGLVTAGDAVIHVAARKG